jgi:D-glycero-D-manno-heptose 1,7-bisphosphate phosphatase
MKTVIMAGGKGTRIASLNAHVPKPMIPICGKPILEWQIECLKRQGYTEVTLIIGYLGQIIQDYFGDGSAFGVQIEYIVETEPFGTAGAMYYLRNFIASDFLLLNGDVLFDIDIDGFYKSHVASGAIVTLFTHPNDHPYDSGIIVSDKNGRVLNWLHKEDSRLWYKNRVNAGLHMMSPRIFEKFSDVKRRDLDRDILKPMISEGTLYVYDSPEYVKEMGTPERFFQVEKDIKSGLIAQKI